MVLAFFEKKRFFFKFGFADSQGGPGRVPRRALGAPEISKGALGKVARVQGGPFWGVLDRQKFARARFLMENWAGFKISVFRFERFLEGPEGVPGACGRATGIPKGGPGRCSKFTLGPRGGSPGFRGPLTGSKKARGFAE